MGDAFMNARNSGAIDTMLAGIEAKVKADLVDISKQITQDFKEQARCVITAYYANYSPLMYERTYNLSSGVINDDISFSVLNGTEYGGGVQFSSAKMFDYTDGGNKDIVVNSFMFGIHGSEKIHVDAVSPMSQMEEFQNSYKNILNGYFTSRGYKVNS